MGSFAKKLVINAKKSRKPRRNEVFGRVHLKFTQNGNFYLGQIDIILSYV